MDSNLHLLNSPKPGYNYEITVAICILKFKEKYLVVKRKKPPFQNTWCIPGGKVEKNETNIIGLERELFEEVGLKNSNYLFFKRYYVHFKDHNYKLDTFMHNLAHTFKISLAKDELSDFLWADKKTLANLDLISGESKIFYDYFESHSQN